MPETIRSLIVVLVLAAPAFYMSRQIASSLISDREFAVWRNIWFAVTIVAFLSANFLVHAAMIFIICYYARSVRAASVGLFFILLLAVPLGDFQIGGAGIVNYLLNLNNARLLAIFLLLPMLLTLFIRNRSRPDFYTAPDRLIICYVLVLTALQFRSEEASLTSVMRSGTIYTLDILIPYFAFSRLVTNVADVRKVFLALVVAALPLTLVAMLELVKGWHLYSALSVAWDGPSSYLRREGLLRASGPASVSIIFGFVMMVAIGFLTGIWHEVRSVKIKAIVSAAFAAALVASLSRGPWVGVGVLLLVSFAIRPNAVVAFSKFIALGIVILAAMVLIPGSARLFDFLPFIGSVEEGSISYRQQLFENAIAVIQQYPLFGTVDYRKTPEMLAMINSEGIIDIVNTYLEIAMKCGLVGLGLFVGIFSTILLRLRRMLKLSLVGDLGNYVRASIATLIAMLVTIATVSNIDFMPYVMWSFAGLCVALVRIGYKERATAANALRMKRAPVLG